MQKARENGRLTTYAELATCVREVESKKSATECDLAEMQGLWRDLVEAVKTRREPLLAEGALHRFD